MAEGMTRVIKRSTGRRFDMSFCLVHYGDHNLSCGVGVQLPPAEHDARIRDLLRAFDRTDLPLMVKGLEAKAIAGEHEAVSAILAELQIEFDLLESDAIANTPESPDSPMSGL